MGEVWQYQANLESQPCLKRSLFHCVTLHSSPGPPVCWCMHQTRLQCAHISVTDSFYTAPCILLATKECQRCASLICLQVRHWRGHTPTHAYREVHGTVSPCVWSQGDGKERRQKCCYYLCSKIPTVRQSLLLCVPHHCRMDVDGMTQPWKACFMPSLNPKVLM